MTQYYNGSKTLLFARGRAALAEAIRLATGGQGQVAVTSLTCYVVIEAIRSVGCQPLFVDVDRQRLQFSAQQLRRAIAGQDVRAIIIQNTLGIAAEISPIEDLARAQNIPLIEDLAHAVGGQYADGRQMGTVGDYTMLSFGRDKLLDTINGGALVIRRRQPPAGGQPEVPQQKVAWLGQLRDRLYPLLACAVRGLMPLGLGKYLLALAYKTKLAVRSADGGTQRGVALPDWQAGLALEQWQRLEATVSSRLTKQRQYLQQLSAFATETSANAVRLPLLADNRDRVAKQLRRQGYFVEDVWYEVPVSPARLYASVQFPESACPSAVAVAQRVVNLPTHQLVTPEDIKQICQIVNQEARPWQ